MDDLISRQAAIDTIRNVIFGFFSDEDGAMTDTEKTLLSVNKAIFNGVRELPSAEPCTEQISKTYTDGFDDGYDQGWKDGQDALLDDQWERERERMSDLISRQAAIDALSCENPTEMYICYDDAVKAIKELPPVEPDLPIKEKCAFCPHCNNCDVNDDLSIQPCVDTISRQAAIEAVRRSEALDRAFGYGHAVDALRELPSAEPEIVRCKDCAVPHNHWTGCPKMNGTVMPEDGFCSFAERKVGHEID